MKKQLLLLFAGACAMFSTQAQSIDLPVNFDSASITYTLADFGGNTSLVTTDPVVSTNKVAKITKGNTAEVWAGTTIGGASGFTNPIPFAVNAKKMSMRVYSPDSGIIVRLKAEDANDPTKSVETDARTTTSNAWETLEFDFGNQASGTAALNLTYTYKKLSAFFNFGVAGSAVGTKDYYCDDIMMMPPSGPILNVVKLPITFDATNVDYTTSDFGGNTTTIVNDPMNANNKVAQTIKSNTAELWAGTTMSTSAGLAERIPFASGSTKIKVKVYSPDSGIAVRLKAEEINDPTKSVETDAFTKTSNAWETLEFDFANQVQGTAAINFAYIYQKLSIFFNFGVTGATAGTKTYYWDDVEFVTSAPTNPGKVNITFSVDVRNLNLSATDTVTLNGTFNGWCGLCNKLTNIPGTKIWTSTLALDTSAEIEYKFTIGNWASQEMLSSSLPCTKTTGNFTNRVYQVGKTNDTLPLVCWESCTNCESSPVKTAVTFRVDMEKYNLNAGDTVTLNGTFNGWCGACTPMMNISGTKIYYATLMLDKDSTYEYKYSIGNWTKQETLTSAMPCTKTTSGFTNRVATISNLNDSLPLVCWESCAPCELTGIANISNNNEVRVYPNPANGFINIDLNKNNANFNSIELFSMTGNLISTTPVTKGNNEITLSTEGLNAGLYLLVCKGEHAVSTHKIKVK